MAHFVERVAALLGGSIRVDVLGNILDTGRPAADLLSMVDSGELTWCYFSSSYLGARVPELNALEVPFLFDGLDAAHAALDGEFGAWLTAATEATTGFEVLGYWDNGFRHLTNRLRPVRVPTDVKGMSARLQPNE
ncbi:MAG: TRAP transporter substrate-binding protein DctP, partial [Acidimicrobiia bacterium]|nr:TRAP transporter substrate-binding protein DctP [Acidimicrobiia bacterium]